MIYNTYPYILSSNRRGGRDDFNHFKFAKHLTQSNKRHEQNNTSTICIAVKQKFIDV